ncbi:hypothetical protein Q6348_11600 [Isoptericola sp. b441]|uniref:HTH rpiR-type domain-containing protein n=1 Tax=Actinotalea lenta TaxID=3064654 RepID=A0ABT9DAA5_9CELL|nr:MULTISPECIES: hypothetical protein [unclassified Isoptericola]MDO8107839.1 hypothetical protein [Isoptericola sp. b441]MDO8120490.1 hypothetical protein [Isoptericola sp. b490]
MLNLDTTKLNPVDQRIVDQLLTEGKRNPSLRIREAAEICGCSMSQVSRAVRKAGFSGYKDFLHVLSTGEQPLKPALAELERLKKVIDDFDIAAVDEFARLIQRHQKITLFGYGPSLICARYFEYKLHLCSSAFVTTAPDEQSARSLLDATSLLIILTTTGQFRSFGDLALDARANGADVVIVSEEFNPQLLETSSHYLVLSDHKQPDALEPYEKTRTVFFIFLEEVISRLRQLGPAAKG